MDQIYYFDKYFKWITSIDAENKSNAWALSDFNADLVQQSTRFTDRPIFFTLATLEGV